MSEIRTDPEQPREALWTFPKEWRVMYFGIFILSSIGFTVLGIVEFRGIGHWIEAPFTSLTSIVIGSGTSAALLSLFLTEIWRLIVTFSTWVAEKLEENLEKSRERRRKEREQRRQERERLLKEVRAQGYEEGRKAGLLEARGEQPFSQPDENDAATS